jgi:hypothetical protein
MPIAGRRFGIYVAVVFLIFPGWMAGQQSVHPSGQRSSHAGQQNGHPAGQSSGSDAVFQPYTTCKFSDGLAVVETTPLDSRVTTRTVQTAKGPKDVQVMAGRRVLFSYPGKDYLANVKAEVLPEKSYAEEKQTLIDDFDFLLASGKDSSRNYALKPTMHGLDIRGLDRDKLEQPVIGFYLLFDDSSHVATTIYLLNQEPSVRSFQTMDEYAAMRDRFLDTYTACIRAKGTKP